MPRTRLQSRQQTEQPSRQDLVASKTNLKRAALEDANGQPRRKRTAFGDITNAIQNVVIDSSKKSKPVPPVKSGNRRSEHPELLPVPESVSEPASARSSIDTISSSKDSLSDASTVSDPTNGRVASRQAAGSPSSGSESDKSNASDLEPVAVAALPVVAVQPADPVTQLPDYDKENLNDIFQVPYYAHDIFKYYKDRESKFTIADYLPQQKELTRQMRTILVDWMVEIQENFELNHETLYQAVKITDLFLSRKNVSKENLQLVGATSLFIACKFDERIPPCSDDFLYICDDAYTRKQLYAMEQEVLICLGFDIGMPLSYRYVRRFAKATKASMETLTLSRYVLEASLMFYDFARLSECELAAAAFLLALRMKNAGDWSNEHVMHSGCEEKQLEPLMWRLNKMIKDLPSNKSVNTVYTKYCHEVFFSVAKTSPLSAPQAA